nr:MAG TPA: hypothetical protein [Caudoviricetes sp.]
MISCITKKSQRLCWCRWLEGGDNKAQEQIHLSFHKSLNVSRDEIKKTQTNA